MKVHGPSRPSDKHPLWTADVDIVQVQTAPGTVHTGPNWAFRSLFVGNVSDGLLAPGTIVALCTINEVDIYVGAQNGQKFVWKAGQAPPMALLVLQAAPGDWDPDPQGTVDVPDCTCVAGEIALPTSVGRPGDPDWRTHFKPIADGVDELAVHSSGLSFTGKTRLPWELNALAVKARFHVMLPFASEIAPLLVELDRDRLSQAGATEMVASFAKLDDILHQVPPPKPAPAPPAPVWVQPGLAHRSVLPQFHWDVTPAAPGVDASAQFIFGLGELVLQLTDGVAGTTDSSVNLATVTPRATFTFDAGHQLVLTLNEFKNPDTSDGKYTWSPTAEAFYFSSLSAAYDPVSMASALRQQYSLTYPDPILLKPDPAVLWGFVPLSDGWVQLPFLNVSESLYANAFPQIGVHTTPPPPNIQGAVSFGNVLKTPRGEQPWSVTLLDADALAGRWIFDTNLKIVSAELRFFAPDVELNGFLWLGMDPPSAADALPSLENWLRGVQMVALRSRHAGDPVPSPLLANFTDVTFQRQTAAGNPPPLLKSFSFGIEPNLNLANPSGVKIYDKLVDGYFPDVYDKDSTGRKIWRNVPLLWRRHSMLPAVQDLPLTQTQDPPNYPSASRQLAPFALDIDPDSVMPKNWTFASTGANAAQSWPNFTGHNTPVAPLPMASLSLPGLSFEPNASDGPIASGYMGAQYRFGLPYLNEIDALSQLSKPKGDTSPTVRPAPPALIRDQYQAYWGQLVVKAALGAAQGDAAVSPNGTQVTVSGLVEPFVWPVSATLMEAAYPGTLTLQDTNSGSALVLEKDPALGGLAGGFDAHDATTLTLAAPANAAAAKFHVVGGSLAAQGGNNAIRDQRGLVRSATVQKTPGNLETPITAADGSSWLLRTTLAPLALSTDANTHWEFWFRDLPANAANNVFDRNLTRSQAARGVNDSAALSPKFVHLTGYEWRMGPSSTGSLPLLGFSFYPLTLEKVEFAGDASVHAVEVVGRLLLQWATLLEEADRANAIRLRFEVRPAGLTLISMNAEDIDPDRDPSAKHNHDGHKGEWLLKSLPAPPNLPAPQAAPVEPDIPVQLFWDTVSLKNGAIVIGDATLDFFFWGKRWVAPITFVGTTGTVPITPAGNDPVRITQATLVLDPLDQTSLALSLDLVYRWGDTKTVFLEVEETRVILATSLSSVLQVFLCNATGRQFQLHASGSSLEGSVQLTWDGLAPGVAIDGWQLLPGMLLDAANPPLSGFAAMTFQVNGFPSPSPLAMQSAFAEALVRCEWGESLQEPGGLTRKRVFGSSAGTLSAGLAWNVSGGKWTASLLLNGLLEVKNLISWPHPNYALATDTLGNMQFTIPGLRAVPAPTLDHARHTIRVLFDQHAVPPDALAAGADHEIFAFADMAGWQTLAIVEHQLVNVQVNTDPAVMPTALAWDRRWTALQEVRLLSPGALWTFLTKLHGQETPQAAADGVTTGDFRDASAFYGGQLLDLLVANPNPILQMSGSLLVEASTVHWVRQKGSPASFTPLQYLPGSAPLGALSTVADFTASVDPTLPEWLLFSMPFLGRLQPPSLDWTDATQPGPLLRVDPIAYLAQARTGRLASLPQIPLLLASWADRSDLAIPVGEFDLASQRLLERLDPASLEECWYRSQTPPREDPPKDLKTVLATPPVDGPGRLGRSAALSRIFEAYRFSLPPSTPDPKGMPPGVTGNLPVEWRRAQTFLLQGFADPGTDYGLYFVAAILYTAPFPIHGKDPATYFPSATMVPPVLTAGVLANPEPVSLAVSPYLGLKRGIPKPDIGDPLLVAGELLGTQVSGDLGPLATQLWWQGQTHDPSKFQAWATDTLARLAPDSRVAVLRLRELRSAKLEDGSRTPTVDYVFFPLQPQAQPLLARNGHPVRTQLQRLRFAEGQFGGNRIPAAFADFEAAPPQVRDVQPIRVQHRPLGDDWPWGVSALRLRVRFTEQAGQPAGMVGPQNGATLWWQATGHAVQFATGEDKELELPPLFRAASIASLLPAPPNPKLPHAELNPAIDPPPPVPDDPWQPVLPGSSDFLVSGARPGAGFVFHNRLLRQTSDGVDISGGIPLQHRMPRPVPLPPNLVVQDSGGNHGNDNALRTWASYFQPDQLLWVAPQPSDTAFLAPTAEDLQTKPEERMVQLTSPRNATVPPDWDLSLTFAIHDTGPAPNWKMTVQLSVGSTSVDYQLDGTGRIWIPIKNDAVTDLLGRLKHGDSITVTVSQEYVLARVKNYLQKIVFSLLVEKPNLLPLPLSPLFAVFEDPEYNRSLTSSTAHAEGVFLDAAYVPPVPHHLHLGLDRREYNALSSFSAVFTDDQGPTNATLRIESIGRTGVPIALTASPVPMTSSELLERSIPELCDAAAVTRPVPGDSLSFTLIAGGKDILTVRVDIVAEPVTPTPQSAFALLKRTGDMVECLRFAWAPTASRIELLNPEDLLGETVRRRAVFSWNYSARQPQLSRFAVQKLTAGGSTHTIEQTEWRKMPTIEDAIATPPTLTTTSLLRGGPGAFGAPRGSGKTHQGVDIVANQSSQDKSIYQVQATAAGLVAYAQINGSATTGYGYTVVVDHNNGFYTLYAHLAINASAGLATVGQAVAQGDIIGYLADLANGEKSSGNVLAEVVAPYDKIQLHIECFEAPQGRSSTTTLAVIKQGCTLDDPTARLTALGYQSY